MKRMVNLNTGDITELCITKGLINLMGYSNYSEMEVREIATL